MADKNDLSEYKFEASEATPIESPAVESAPSTDDSIEQQNFASGRAAGITGMVKQILGKFNLGQVNLKRFTRPALIVFSILVIYVGFNFYSSRKAESSERAKMAAQARAASVARQSARQKVALPVIDMSMIQAEDKESMQQKMEEMVNYINDANEHMSDMSEQIMKTQQELSVTNQNIEQLTMAMQQMFMDVEKLKFPPKKMVKKKPAKVPVAYYVRAIVPGRVWLESVDGKNVTLRVGDKLPGYGEVRMISPRQGMVVMSNGSIIQYGMNDV